MIQLKDISLSYNDKVIFDHFNLSIDREEKILLDAPSGKGKTTLMKLILGFIKQDKGDIVVNGTILTAKTLRSIRKDIAYVSQDVDFHNMKVDTLLDQVQSFKVNKNVDFSIDKVDRLFDLFGIKHIRSKMIDDISGGERQRLGLVVALLLDRPILLLDEVTSGLDKEMKETTINYIMSLKKTILIISHDQLWKEQRHTKVVEW